MTFRSVLIANRGEIALRIIRACRRLGLRSIAVYSEADRCAPYLKLADQAICIGAAPAAQSYLDAGIILLAAAASGAEAIHPGYGFLSENSAFAQAVQAAGLTFIGPTPQVIALMGDKISAKQAMLAAGVPCVPGSSGALPADAQQCAAIAAEVGYPVIIKASGGGGGRGMRVVHNAGELTGAVAETRELAARTFGNPEVYIEKFLQAPRHIEIQMLCDQHGHAIWVGERDCSVQRRHQKVVEEAPAPGIDRGALEQLGARCVQACQAIGYTGVGTFEFLYEAGLFAFIEMNTRIQVEHPVTEAITGIDLVYEQMRVAAGAPLLLKQEDIVLRGHAIECRINAESPFTGMPSPGTITSVHAPGGPGIRFDSHIAADTHVPSNYDSLVGKLIAWGRDRTESIARMQAALGELDITGITVNTPLHRELMADAAFMQGGVDIHYLEHRQFEAPSSANVTATATPRTDPRIKELSQ